MRAMLLTALAGILVAAGCASDGDDPTSVGTTTTTPPTSLQPAPAHASTAVITIADQQWEFEASCAQPSEGEVFVWGSGLVPDSERPSELLLEASAATPYVGISGDGRLIEASIDTPLILSIDAGTITGEDISFVADADIETGLGAPLGTGSVEVRCTRYEEPLAGLDRNDPSPEISTTTS